MALAVSVVFNNDFCASVEDSLQIKYYKWHGFPGTLLRLGISLN